MSVKEKRRLGRGLNALIGDEPTTETNGQAPTRLPIDSIENNPYQPRRDFDAEELSSLQESLKNHGLLQPVVVRQKEGGYQLIAGERRLRAAREVGWSDVPVRVIDLNDREVFEAAMVENLQRTDLNPIEKAQGFQQYITQYNVSQDEVARRMGLDRSTITNFIRLLELPPPVQEAARLGQISNGHARALLSIDDPKMQESICAEIIAKGLSVRAVESLVRESKAAPPAQPTPEAQEKTNHVKSIEDELRQKLAMRVEVQLKGKEKGRVVISFENNDDFERILSVLR